MNSTFDARDVRDILIHNAFNSFGDTTGSDDFGASYAWVDLHDHLETSQGRALDPSEAEELIDEIGGRYVIVILWANGVVGYDDFASKRDMMQQFRMHETDFNEYMSAFDTD